MHSINIYTHFFFVPNRILWDGWEDFITGGETGEDATPWANATYVVAANQPGSLADYMGLPVNGDQQDGGPAINISPLSFSAYQKIYNDYYRDQNLSQEIPYKLSDGSNNGLFGTHLDSIRTRAWQHDYFTSALPFPQKGPQALLPLGDEAPIRAYAYTGPESQGNGQRYAQVSDNNTFGGEDLQTDGA